MLSDIPTNLQSGPVTLVFEKIVTPNHPTGEEVPFYKFNVLRLTDKEKVGEITLRVGDTRHVNLCAGHIGYNVKEEHRGNSYSYYACLALAPFIRRHYQRVILTTDPDNIPSIKIVEKLGARFLSQIEVPEDDPAYRAARQRLRYDWEP